MVKRLVLAVAVAAAAAAALVACDVLVDLGPTAKLRDAGVVPPVETGPADTGVIDAGPPDVMMLTCGLQPVANKVCDDCTNQHCCDISTACGMNPKCIEGEMQLLNCVYQPVCVGQIDSEYPDTGVVDLQNCVINYCMAPCFPGAICNGLAPCCLEIGDAEALVRQVCVAAVNLLDENNCMKVLVDTLRPALGSQFCGGPPPDAGGG
jgi:hypothetical protein